MRKTKSVLAAALVALAAGCAPSIHGTWTADTSGEHQSPIASVSFCPDGTFTAESDYNGKKMAMSGHFCMCGDKLCLETEGRKREYGVGLSPDGNTLTVKHADKASKMTRMNAR